MCEEAEYRRREIKHVYAMLENMIEQRNELASLIYNAAIGKLSMNVNADLESMAERVYGITHMTATQIEEDIKRRKGVTDE
ncbi:MAG: hypothetical protein CMO80_22115 [Verrucomicrobiales bacterium]|nr:hypothetical protein [Verrucomicrobiales bacterium]|tara:strand:+ start:20927 stop:21169 length:243 start_codon:yes stop_codon:yes gene_type:complete